MKVSHITLASFLVVALASCSEDGQPAPTVTVTETVTAQATESPEATEVLSEDPVEVVESSEGEPETQERYISHGRSDRDYLIKHIGDWAGISSESDEDVMVADFRITKVDDNAKCSARYANKSKNGQYMRIDFEIETYKELSQVGDFSISEYDFKAFLEDGSRVNDVVGNSYLCLNESETVPSTIGPGEKVTGSIVLDVPKGVSTIVYESWMTGSGWEWPVD